MLFRSMIVTNFHSPTGAYSWNVPNTPSVSCLFKVVDNDNGVIVDISDNVFEIVERDPSYSWWTNNLLNVQENTNEQLLWNSFNVGAYSLIEYSYDSAATWHTVDITATHSLNYSNYTDQDYDGVWGSYEWSVPNTPSTTCFLRLSDTSDVSINKISTMFTIRPQDPPIWSVTPSGTIKDGCEVINITWQANEYAIAGPVSGDYNILLSVDGGLTYDTLASNSSHGINGLQSWQWLVPNISTSSALLRIEDAQDSSTFSISTNSFTINPTTVVVLFTPNIV